MRPRCVRAQPNGFTRKMVDEVKLGPNVRPLSLDAIGDVGRVLWVLFGMVGIVLLIACANLANLFLVRAEGRQQELAIRSALGADRWQLARELLGESVTLGLGGGVLGVGLAWAAVKLLVTLAPLGLPRLEEIAINPVVLIFTLAISLVAGLLFGLVPVVRFWTPRITALKDGGVPGRHRGLITGVASTWQAEGKRRQLFCSQLPPGPDRVTPAKRKGSGLLG